MAYSTITSVVVPPKVPGQRVSPELTARLRQKVASLIGANSSDRFPGAQPISFSSSDISRLTSEYFYVSEKADGTRCLMFTHISLSGKIETFLFPKLEDSNAKQRSSLGNVHDNTILDGELVEDTEPNGKKTLWFLWFDCLVLDGENILDKPYDKRLGRLIYFVEKPYFKEIQRVPSFTQNHPFKMKVKKLELSYGMENVFKSIPTLKHKSDGIIFTSKTAKYKIGTCENMIKWKPADENTVDFKVRKSGPFHSPTFKLQIWDGKGNIDVSDIHLDEDLFSKYCFLKVVLWNHNPPENRVIECRYDPTWPKFWRFVRYRDDKDTANHISTYQKVRQSIDDGVDKETLLSIIPTIERNWKIRNGTLDPDLFPKSLVQPENSDVQSQQIIDTNLKRKMSEDGSQTEGSAPSLKRARAQININEGHDELQPVGEVSDKNTQPDVTSWDVDEFESEEEVLSGEED
ncbi:Dcp1p-Dcp2p decapping enzyme complex alpha subunit, partial [Nowakowskiella sp. JEL0078]